MPGGVQTGWTYKSTDRTIRNTNFPAACLDIGSSDLSRAIMVSDYCYVDDPRAPDSWWLSRFVLQP
jgi:hypothetical protein